MAFQDLGRVESLLGGFEREASLGSAEWNTNRKALGLGVVACQTWQLYLRGRVLP